MCRSKHDELLIPGLNFKFINLFTPCFREGALWGSHDTPQPDKARQCSGLHLATICCRTWTPPCPPESGMGPSLRQPPLPKCHQSIWNLWEASHCRRCWCSDGRHFDLILSLWCSVLLMVIELQINFGRKSSYYHYPWSHLLHSHYWFELWD